MGRITSSIGLVTGLPITDTVDKLISVSAQPRDRLIKRTQNIAAQQLAITELTAVVLGVQIAGDKLGNDFIFDTKKATSSDPSALSVNLTGNPPLGDFQFTPVRQAQSHQLLSSGFTSLSDPIGSSGSFSLRFGGFVDSTISLADLNAGQGVQRGKIRITDRSGSSAEIDLRFVQSVDEVLKAINSESDINVTAVAEGDTFRLIDNTGLTISNLKVQEVGSGSTAADLGFAGVNVAADEVTGTDVLRLYNDALLSSLNDGNGISFHELLPDLDITFRDNSDPLLIDFHQPGTDPGNATTTTIATNGVDASFKITAVDIGGDFDDVTILFIDDGSVTKGNETVVYNGSDPDNRTLTFNIKAGETTAADLIIELNNDVTAKQFFTATFATGGNGGGIVSLTDTGVTTGGEGIEEQNELTIGDLLDTLNNIDPARLSAEIDASGERIRLIDLTVDSGGTFSVTSALSGSVAEDLGLTGTAVAGVITSQRLQAGLKTTLLSSLEGGSGLGQLGLLDITDRSGATASVDLSTAETLQDVISAINGAGIGITADVNDARNGISLTDTTAATASNLIVANGDATNTADALKLVIDSAVTSVNSKSLHRQSVSEQTRLEDYNGGQGVAGGQFIITDSAGSTAAANIGIGTDTIGDVIDVINNLSVNVEARINDAGDGIVLIDHSSGSGSLSVRTVGSDKTAADLHIIGTGTEVVINGSTKEVIAGASTLLIEYSDTDTLQDVIDQINDLDIGVSASSFSDGTGAKPIHLSLFSRVLGKSGELLVDSTDASFTFDEIASAQDALLLFGSADSDSAGVLSSSSTNVFDNVLDGVRLTLTGTSTSSITISVKTTNDAVISSVELFVNQYNRLRDKLGEMTFFNQIDRTKGILFGSSETLRVDSEFSSLLSGRFFGAGSIQGIESLGIEIGEDGKLSLNTTKLLDKLRLNRDAVQDFFTKETRGFSAKIHNLVESIAGVGSSLLVNRAVTLQRKIDLNTERIIFQSQRLEVERDALLKQFFNMELAIGKLLINLSAIESIKSLPSLLIR